MSELTTHLIVNHCPEATVAVALAWAALVLGMFAERWIWRGIK